MQNIGLYRKDTAAIQTSKNSKETVGSMWKEVFSTWKESFSPNKSPVIVSCSFTLHPNSWDRGIYTYRFSQCFVSEIFIILRGNRWHSIMLPLTVVNTAGKKSVSVLKFHYNKKSNKRKLTSAYKVNNYFWQIYICHHSCQVM